MKKHLMGILAAAMSVMTLAAAVTETTVVSPGEDGGKYYRIPAIVKAHNGDLVAVYDWRGDSKNDILQNGAPKGRVKLMRKISSDNGATWSKQQELYPGFINEREHGDAALVNDLSIPGHIVCVMATDAFYGADGGKIFVSHSRNNGADWDRPTEMVIANRPDWKAAFVASGNMLYTKEGHIMCVVLGRTAQIPGGMLYVLRSTDHGNTWEVVGTAGHGNESKLAEMPDGSLLMSIRNNGLHKFATSDDGGVSWSQFNSTVTESGVNGAILPVLSGTDEYLFMSLADSPGSRAHLSIYYSTTGKDWASRCTIHKASAAYSDMVELGDKIGVFAEVAEGTSDNYTLKFFAVDKADILPGQGKDSKFDGSLVCNGRGFASIPAHDAFNIPAGGQMTITCRALLNGSRANLDQETLDLGLIATRAYDEHTTSKQLHYKGFSGFEFIAGHNLAAGQTLGTNVTYDKQSDFRKACLPNAYNNGLKISQWSHVAAVFDFSDAVAQVKVYVDGILMEQQSGAKDKMMSAPLGVLLGSRFNVDYDKHNVNSDGSYTWLATPAENSAIFDSNIDDVRFYNTAFSKEQIRKDMASGFPILNASQGLIAAYDFADMTDKGVFTDISGNNHDATAHTRGTYLFPKVYRDIPLTQTVDESKGSLIVERFTGGSPETIDNAITYMASRNENFRVSAEAKDGYELIGLFVNGHIVDNGTFIKTGSATEVEARFRPADKGIIYLVGDITDHKIKEEFRLAPLGNGEYSIFINKLQGKFYFVELFESLGTQASDATDLLPGYIVLDSDLIHVGTTTTLGYATHRSDVDHKLKRSNGILAENPFAPYGIVSDNHYFGGADVRLHYRPEENLKYFNLAGVTTGVENVGDDTTGFDGEPEYYTVQGIRVSPDNLSPGIYIVRRGQNITKEIVR